MTTKLWIVVAVVTVCAVCKVFAAPQPSSTPVNDKAVNEKAVDNDKQTTPWKNKKEIERALNFHYPVLSEDQDPMPEKTLNMNGRIDLSRQIRQSSDDAAPTPPSLQDYLLFANRQYLVSINKNGTGAQALTLTNSLATESPNAIGIDFDIRNDLLFWSDVQFKLILVAYLNGSNLTALVSTNITTPDGLAWDWVNHMLYWTDAGDRDIEVYDAIGGYRKKLIQSGPNAKPRAIVVDPANRVMYWTDWGTPATIERASMDGTSHVVLHNTTLVWPNGLTIDYATQTLYWADAFLDRIESSGTDGKQRRLLSTSFVFHPFGIEFCQGYLYWTDWRFNAVLKANVSQMSSVGVVISGLFHDPMAIRAVSLERQPISGNPCRASNGGCSHLCLLSSSNPVGYSCACPDGFELGASQKNCTAICEESCLNGGSCVAPNQCFCTEEYTGSQCETKKDEQFVVSA